MATVEGATHIVRYGNPAFCRLMGQPLDQLVGKPFDELLPEKDQCVTLLDRVFRTRKPENYTEQEPFQASSCLLVLYDLAGAGGRRVVGVMIQVTETGKLREETLAMNEALMLGSLRQHELTEAAENLNAQLRTEITERRKLEDSLLARASDLARADRSKDEFLAMLSHELRNPLAALRNVAEILNTSNASAEERGEAQGILARQIENMTRMIDDLLDVSRITEGKIERIRLSVHV